MILYTKKEATVLFMCALIGGAIVIAIPLISKDMTYIISVFAVALMIIIVLAAPLCGVETDNPNTTEGKDLSQYTVRNSSFSGVFTVMCIVPIALANSSASFNVNETVIIVELVIFILASVLAICYFRKKADQTPVQ